LAFDATGFPFPGLLDEFFHLDKELNDDVTDDDEDEIPEESPGV
jgi:hypothetical protein